MDDNAYAMYITGQATLRVPVCMPALCGTCCAFCCYAKQKEGWYFSYNQDMSAHHPGKVRELIAVNPYYNDLMNFKGQTDSVLGFAMLGNGQPLDRAPKFVVKPSGLLVFKRGIHADLILCGTTHLKTLRTSLLPWLLPRLTALLNRAAAYG